MPSRAVVRSHDTMPGCQAAVLEQLARDGDLSITELAERELVRHQSMARTVKLLETRGLIDVVRDKIDRRRVVIRITIEGSSQLGDERRQRPTGSPGPCPAGSNPGIGRCFGGFLAF